MINPILNIASSISKQNFIQRTANKLGSFIPDKFIKNFEFKPDGTLDRMPLFLIALFFVLGIRIYKSRDNHERREVLTRDGVTVGAAMLAVPFVKKHMEKWLDNFSKIPTAGDTGFANLENIYGKANSLPEKALSVAKHISEKKGDVKKAFSTLGENASVFINTLLQGKENTSENIIKSLENAISSKDNKIITAFNGLSDILSNSKNELVQTAQRLKSLPAVASLAFVTLLLGWGIPAFNIHITRNKFKHHHKHDLLEPKINENQQKIISSFFSRV